MSGERSVRFPLGLGEGGYRDIEVISERGCCVQVKAQPGDDNVVIVEVNFPVMESGGEPVGDECQGHKPIPYTAEDGAGVRDRHVVRVGNGGFGCVRVLSHEVSPYRWRLVNFGASQQSGKGMLGNLDSLNAKPAGVEP